MRIFLFILIGFVFSSLAFLTPTFAQEGENVYSFSAKTIDGEMVSLGRFDNKVLLIVNTASRCGFTPQYASLEKLYQQFKDRGFLVLAFPANNFMGQEPGTDEEIKNFCFLNFKTSFPLFAKINVKDKDIHPLYDFLTTRTNFPGPVQWNFNKFLVNRSGQVVARFATPVDPMSEEIVTAVEAELGKP